MEVVRCKRLIPKVVLGAEEDQPMSFHLKCRVHVLVDAVIREIFNI